MNDLATLPDAERDAQIMLICDRAIEQLGEARDIEAVVQVRNIAEAFSTYARKLKAAHEAQNACVRVTMLAELRIGRELEAAQHRNELQTPGGNWKKTQEVQGSDRLKITLREVGIPKQRAAEMKLLSAAGPEAVEAEVAAANAEGRRASKARVLRGARHQTAGAGSPQSKETELCKRMSMALMAIDGLSRELADPATLSAELTAGRLAVTPDRMRSVIDFLQAALRLSGRA